MKKLYPVLRNLKGLYFLANKNLWKENKFLIYKRKAFKIFNKQKDQDPYSIKRLLNLIIKPYEKKLFFNNFLSYKSHLSFYLQSINFKTIKSKKLTVCTCKDCGVKFSFS